MKTIPRGLLAFSIFCLIRAGAWAAELEALVTQDKPAADLKQGAAASRTDSLLSRYLITVTDDFIVAAYHNGELIPEEQRELLLDRFGASVERINVEVRSGDWLVFNVVHNPKRWDASKYFAVAGCLAHNEFAFTSDPASSNWSFCDDPTKAVKFIKQRNAGRAVRALEIDKPWSEGNDFIRNFAGDDFGGKPLWGRERSTWIKFVALKSAEEEEREKVVVEKKKDSVPSKLELATPKRWPMQVLSAEYGTGGKDADVTAKVKDYLETQQRPFSSDPV
ncbi:MAG TPA: hypothetical protein VF593_12500, partial [Chthoniobacteraceae bacterium]